MLDRAYIISRTLEDKIAIAENIGQNTMIVTLDVLKEILTMLKEQPEIIRCQDCKYYKDGFCYNPNTYDDEKTKGNTVPDWFCADGDRRNVND